MTNQQVKIQIKKNFKSISSDSERQFRTIFEFSRQARDSWILFHQFALFKYELDIIKYVLIL